MKKIYNIAELQYSGYHLIFPHIFLNDDAIKMSWVYNLNYITVPNGMISQKIAGSYNRKLQIKFNPDFFHVKYREIYIENPSKFQNWFYNYLIEFLNERDLELIKFA